MTQLETAMAILMKTFDKYAASEGNESTLTKNELKTLMERELPGLIKEAKDKDQVEMVLKGLDFNGDQVIDFSEFILMVAALCCACHGRPCKK